MSENRINVNSGVVNAPQSSVLELDGNEPILPDNDRVSNTSGTFDITDFLHELTPNPNGEKDKYVCKACGGHNLSIQLKTKKYKCFNGCSNAEVREAIRPWAERVKQQGNATHTRTSKSYGSSTPKRKPKPAPIPDTREMATLPEGMDIKISNTYKYTPYQQTRRINKPDGTKKGVYPYHWDSQMNDWVKGKGGDDVIFIPYQLEEINKYGAGKWILMVEGEKCVDYARKYFRLVATTFAGHCWEYEALRKNMPLVRGVQGSHIAGIVFWPDHDTQNKDGTPKTTGYDKAAKCRDVCDELGIPFVQLNPIKIWEDMPEGGDIADVYEAGIMSNGDELIAVLKAQIDALDNLQSSINEATENEPKENAKDKTKDLPPANIIANRIARLWRDKIAFNNENQKWMLYGEDADGKWRIETPEYIESRIKKYLQSQNFWAFSGNYLTNIIRLLRSEVIVRQWNEPPSNKFLPFQNGVLEIATGKLLPHDPDYRFTWQLPRNHDPLATDWTNISNFLDHLSAGNKQIKDVLICYCNAVIKGRADLQKFLHLIGLAGTGKGTFSRLVVNLIGRENVHVTDLKTWCNNNFDGYNAYQKRLVLFPDERTSPDDLGNFLKVTGEDVIRAEPKREKAFNFTFDGMVLICSNYNIPGFKGGAIDRRKFPIACNNPVSISDKRKNIEGKFQDELAAFTNYLLSLSDSYVTDVLGGALPPESALEAWLNFTRIDALAEWVNDNLIRDPNAVTAIGNDKNEGSNGYPPSTLYGSYARHCQSSGNTTKATKSFSPDLIELLNSVMGWKVEKINRNSGKYISGVRLRRPGQDDHIPTYENLLEAKTKSDGFDPSRDGLSDGSEPLPCKESDGCDESNQLTEENQNSEMQKNSRIRSAEQKNIFTEVDLTRHFHLNVSPSKHPDSSLDSSRDESLSVTHPSPATNQPQPEPTQPEPTQHDQPVANPQPQPEPQPQPQPKIGKVGDSISYTTGTKEIVTATIKSISFSNGYCLRDLTWLPDGETTECFAVTQTEISDWESQTNSAQGVANSAPAVTETLSEEEYF